MDKPALLALIAKLEARALFFGILVAIGVAGESVYGIRLYWNNRKLQRMEVRDSQAQQAEIARLNNDTERLRANNLTTLQLLLPRHLNQNAIGENGRLLAGLKQFAGIPVFVQHVDDHEAKELALEMLTLFRGCGMIAVPVDQLRTHMPEFAITEGVTIYTHRSQHPEEAPYDLDTVPPLKTDTPEEKAWFAARMFTKAFLLWGVQTFPNDLPDFDTSPLAFSSARNSLFVAVGPLPTSKLVAMRERMLYELQHSTGLVPEPSPRVLNKQ